MKAAVVGLLQRRGVKLQEIAEIVHQLQKPYHPSLQLGDCLESVETVLEKREVQFNILTGIALDEAAERGQLDEPLLSTIRTDCSLYGIDEVLALGIANIYGSIGVTNFGYLDKEKLGVIGRVDREQKAGGQVNTFLDDLIAGIAAAASARVAHQRSAEPKN